MVDTSSNSFHTRWCQRLADRTYRYYSRDGRRKFFLGVFLDPNQDENNILMKLRLDELIELDKQRQTILAHLMNEFGGLTVNVQARCMNPQLSGFTRCLINNIKQYGFELTTNEDHKFGAPDAKGRFLATAYPETPICSKILNMVTRYYQSVSFVEELLATLLTPIPFASPVRAFQLSQLPYEFFQLPPCNETERQQSYRRLVVYCFRHLGADVNISVAASQHPSTLIECFISDNVELLLDILLTQVNRFSDIDLVTVRTGVGRKTNFSESVLSCVRWKHKCNYFGERGTPVIYSTSMKLMKKAIQTIRHFQETRLSSADGSTPSLVAGADQVTRMLSHELSALPKTLTSFNLMRLWRTVRKDVSTFNQGRLQLLRQFIQLLENDPKSIHLTEFYNGESLLSVMIRILSELPASELKTFTSLHYERFLELLSLTSIHLVSTFAFFHDYQLTDSPLWIMLNYFQQRQQQSHRDPQVMEEHKSDEDQEQFDQFMNNLWHILIRQLNQIVQLYQSDNKQEQLTTIYTQQLRDLYDDQLYPYPMDELTSELDTLLSACYASMVWTIRSVFQSFVCVDFHLSKSLSGLATVVSYLSHLTYVQAHEFECLGILIEGAIVNYYANRSYYPTECSQSIQTILTFPRFQTTDLFQPIRTRLPTSSSSSSSLMDWSQMDDSGPIYLNGKTISEFVEQFNSIGLTSYMVVPDKNEMVFRRTVQTKDQKQYQTELSNLIAEIKLNWTNHIWPTIHQQLTHYVIPDLSELVIEYLGGNKPKH